MPCFSGTNLVCLIAALCLRTDRYSTIYCRSPNTLNNLCILVGLQHPTKKCFPSIHIPKALLKNSSCGPETAIDDPGPSIEYAWWPNIAEDLNLENLSMMALLDLSQVLSTVVTNNVSKLFIFYAYGGGSFPTFSLLCPGRTIFGTEFIPGPATIVLSWDFNYFCVLGGT